MFGVVCFGLCVVVVYEASGDNDCSIESRLQTASTSFDVGSSTKLLLNYYSLKGWQHAVGATSKHWCLCLGLDLHNVLEIMLLIGSAYILFVHILIYVCICIRLYIYCI